MFCAPTLRHLIVRLAPLAAWLSACSAAGPRPGASATALPALATSSLPGALAQLKMSSGMFLSGGALDEAGGAGQHLLLQPAGG